MRLFKRGWRVSTELDDEDQQRESRESILQKAANQKEIEKKDRVNGPNTDTNHRSKI